MRSPRERLQLRQRLMCQRWVIDLAASSRPFVTRDMQKAQQTDRQRNDLEYPGTQRNGWSRLKSEDGLELLHKYVDSEGRGPLVADVLAHVSVDDVDRGNSCS
jgi:hypothetical protein